MHIRRLVLVLVVALLATGGASEHSAGFHEEGEVHPSDAITPYNEYDDWKPYSGPQLEWDVKYRGYDEYPQERGWVRGQRVHYYDFGPWNGELNPAYVFYWKNGQRVENQPPVYQHAPRGVHKDFEGTAKYSDLKRLYKVIVPDHYTVNSVRSKQQVENSGYTIKETNKVLLHVLTDGDSELEDDPFYRSPQKAWIKGRKVHYFDFSRWEGETELVNGEVPVQQCFDAANWARLQDTVFQALPEKILRWKPYRDRIDNNPDSYSPLCRHAEFHPVGSWYRPDRVRDSGWLLSNSSEVGYVHDAGRILDGYDNHGQRIDSKLVLDYAGKKRVMPIVEVKPGRPQAGGELDDVAGWRFTRLEWWEEQENDSPYQN